MVKFEKQSFGAITAAIFDDGGDTFVEVMAREDGDYDLTIHSRRSDSDTWDDLTARMSERHYRALGEVADHMAARHKTSK